MADQNREADLVKTPEVGALRYFNEDPAEKESIERDQNKRMREVAVIFEIELAVEKAKNEIGVREESHAQTCNRSPMTNFLVINRPRNHRPCQDMSKGVHFLMLTDRSLRSK